jgi:hypothetical protein
MDLRTFGGFELTDTSPDGQTTRIMGTTLKTVVEPATQLPEHIIL